MGSFELIEFHYLSQEFHRPDKPARESFYHGASSPGLPLPTDWDDRVGEIFFQDRHAILPPHLVARDVVSQLSPSCASFEKKAGIFQASSLQMCTKRRLQKRNHALPSKAPPWLNNLH